MRGAGFEPTNGLTDKILSIALTEHSSRNSMTSCAFDQSRPRCFASEADLATLADATRFLSKLLIQ